MCVAFNQNARKAGCGGVTDVPAGIRSSNGQQNVVRSHLPGGTVMRSQGAAGGGWGRPVNGSSTKQGAQQASRVDEADAGERGRR